MERKRKRIIIIVAIVVVMVIIYVICAATGNLKSETDNVAPTATVIAPTSSNGGLIKHTEIIWNDDDRTAISNLYLDGTRIKESIIIQYYQDMYNVINDLDRDMLANYDYIEFFGHVVRDEKIESIISGKITTDYILNADTITPVSLEQNIVDLFIPAPLRDDK